MGVGGGCVAGGEGLQLDCASPWILHPLGRNLREIRRIQNLAHRLSRPPWRRGPLSWTLQRCEDDASPCLPAARHACLSPLVKLQVHARTPLDATTHETPWMCRCMGLETRSASYASSPRAPGCTPTSPQSLGRFPGGRALAAWSRHARWVGMGCSTQHLSPTPCLLALCHAGAVPSCLPRLGCPGLTLPSLTPLTYSPPSFRPCSGKLGTSGLPARHAVPAALARLLPQRFCQRRVHSGPGRRGGAGPGPGCGRLELQCRPGQACSAAAGGLWTRLLCGSLVPGA